MSWIYFNPNPANKAVSDCTVRALCKAENIDWFTAYFSLCVTGGILYDMPKSNEVFRALLRKWGYSRHSIPNSCPDCYTVREFCEDNNTGCYILGTGDHVVTIINGDYYDAWDSGNEVPLYYYKRDSK